MTYPVYIFEGIDHHTMPIPSRHILHNDVGQEDSYRLLDMFFAFHESALGIDTPAEDLSILREHEGIVRASYSLDTLLIFELFEEKRHGLVFLFPIPQVVAGTHPPHVHIAVRLLFHKMKYPFKCKRPYKGMMKSVEPVNNNGQVG